MKESRPGPLPVAPLGRYLESTTVIDWHAPVVQSTARELVARIDSDIDKAKFVFEWVRDNISHSKDVGCEKVTCTASEVLCEKTGTCYAKSHLLAALLRADSIPAGFCYQIFEREPPLTGRALHGLNGIYLASVDRWLRLDCRGNKEGVDSQFHLEREQIAWPKDPFFDWNVYPDPFASVTCRRE